MKKTYTSIFSSLSKYPTRAGVRPLENFVTEAVGYFLSNDEQLLKKYIERILRKDIAAAERVKIITQFPCDAGYIDLAIFWHEHGETHSLFVEHKIWSSPWEWEDDEGFENDQITVYCKYQEGRFAESDVNHHVALMSSYPLTGYSQEDKKELPAYLGNYTWWDMRDLLNNHTMNSNHPMAKLERQFVDFMKEENMAGFDNFTMDELASLSPFEQYEEKRKGLANRIYQFCTPDAFKQYKTIKYYQSPTKQDMHGYWGAIYHDYEEIKYPEEASFWIFVGLAFNENDEWYPKTSYSSQKIPEVQCFVGKWFDNEDQIKDFVKKNSLNKWSKEENKGFEFTSYSSHPVHYIALVKRDSLLHFLQKESQEEEIWNFLQTGFKEIANKEGKISNLIKALLE